MTAKEFYDWQTAGGTNDVMRLADILERAGVEVHASAEVIRGEILRAF